MTTNKRGIAVALSCILLALLANYLFARNVDGDVTPHHSIVKVHVAGPTDSGGAYTAEEDTAWCVAPSVEVSYTSNADGSGTVECSS